MWQRRKKNNMRAIMFLIEDTLPLGSIAIDKDSKQHPIIVLLYKAFWDVFRNATNLDYILASSSACNDNFVWFADRYDLAVYYEHAIDYDKMVFSKP